MAADGHGHTTPQGYITIDAQHWRIHNGSHFFAGGTSPLLGNGDTFDVAVTTPSDVGVTLPTYNASGEFSSTGPGLLELFEGATLTALTGQVVPFYNNDRNCIKTSSLTAIVNPTVTDTGVAIVTEAMGSTGPGTSLGGLAVQRAEILLKYDTVYLVRFTSMQTAGNIYANQLILVYENM